VIDEALHYAADGAGQWRGLQATRLAGALSLILTFAYIISQYFLLPAKFNRVRDHKNHQEYVDQGLLCHHF
jgi:hypothetical protein